MSGFTHALNAQGRFITASPDGSRIYVGGDFTTVDGAARGHIAAFNVADGSLVANFSPKVGSTVRAIQSNNSTVWVGGSFQGVGVNARANLAAFNASNGSILPWAPTADDEAVWSMVLTPDQSRVIVGGAFSTLNGVGAYGLGALDASTGATLPWAANQTIRDAGANGAIYSLRTDGEQVYGTGYAFGSGASFEHTFAADPTTGNINWLNDCHGDTYDTFPIDGVLYSVSHSHDCSPIGDFPETPVRSYHYLLASPTHANGVNTGPDSYGWNYSGWPAAKHLHFFPKLAGGAYTGQAQAGWSLAGNSDYLAVGGEFPTVNGAAQQGLTRFAKAAIAPNKRGVTQFDPQLVPASVQSGEVRVRWRAQWDMDNAKLRYDLYRDASPTPIYTTTLDSNFWNRPSMSFKETGLAPGSTHTYRIKVTDPFNNSSSSGDVPVTVSSESLSAYSTDVLDDGATNYWRMDETTGTTLADFIGQSDMTAAAGVTKGTAGAFDSNTAMTFSGSSNGTAGTTGTVETPTTFSISAWFKTSTSRGGKIVGYGDSQLGTSSNYDRHIYMDNNGRVNFGVHNGTTSTVTSASTYRDNIWHQVVASQGPDGMTLYVDGKRVGFNASVTNGSAYTGYWRIGGDNLSWWPNKPTSNWFAGAIDDVAIYDEVLTVQQVQEQYLDAGKTLAVPAAPADAYGQSVYNSGPNAFWRLNETSGTTANDSSRYFVNGTYTALGVTKNVTGPIAGNNGVTLNGASGSVGATVQETSPQRYSGELWFKTNTTRGGKLFSFGSSASGSSTNVDRQVYMLDNGKLRFGVNPGTRVTIDSAASYNNNQWHHLVANQSADGMRMYVDGTLVASGPTINAQSFTGYWRVGGGDTNWGGATSSYFAGTIDEAAFYDKALSLAEIRAHYLGRRRQSAERQPGRCVHERLELPQRVVRRHRVERPRRHRRRLQLELRGRHSSRFGCDHCPRLHPRRHVPRDADGDRQPRWRELGGPRHHRGGPAAQRSAYRGLHVRR